jgi:hypothetical protein
MPPDHSSQCQNSCCDRRQLEDFSMGGIVVTHSIAPRFGQNRPGSQNATSD